MSTVPLERFHDLTGLSDAGFDLDVVPGAEELRALADWAGVDEVSQLKAHIFVQAQSKTRFREEIDLEADIVQSCVVTLEPVRTHICRNFVRSLHLVPGVERFDDKGGLVGAIGETEDSPDEIVSPVYDLGIPLREEFALAIDRYPRAAGVAFEAPEDHERAESPFAVLQKLKQER